MGLFEKTDEDLMKGIVKGDTRAFDKLFSRHAPGIFNYCRQRLGKKELAEEITQECFMKLWEKSEKFDQTRTFKVWFWTLVRNRLNDHWREAYQTPPMEEWADLGIEVREDELEKLISKESKEEVERIFFHLNESYREILSLWMQDLSYEEISKITGKSLDATKSSLKRAKQEFQKNWTGLL